VTTQQDYGWIIVRWHVPKAESCISDDMYTRPETATTSRG
jgi:hypothetical protein